MTAFTSTFPYIEEHPSALAIYCADGRFTMAIEDLCANFLGVPRIDTVTIPGGSGVFSFARFALFDRVAISRAVDFLVLGHGIRRIFLIAHAGCGFYRARGYLQMREIQERDLCIAESHLRMTYPEIEVDKFYAVSENGCVRFDRVV